MTVFQGNLVLAALGAIVVLLVWIAVSVSGRRDRDE